MIRKIIHLEIKKVISRSPATLFDTPEDANVSESARDF